MINKGKCLTDIASVIRSKNAGPYEITLDIFFHDERDYGRVRESGIFTKKLIAGLYRTSPGKVKNIIFFTPALALKITLEREIVSGGIGDTDVYGAQQHGPLLELEIPL